MLISMLILSNVAVPESPEESKPEDASGNIPDETAPPTEPSDTSPQEKASVKPPFIDPELSFILDRLPRHANLVNAVLDLPVTSGIVRFRAAATLILNDARERNYRRTWPALRRRRDIRKMFVSAYAVKMMHDDAFVLWEWAHDGAVEAEELYEALLKEVPPSDKGTWTSLARLEYRHTIIHM